MIHMPTWMFLLSILLAAGIPAFLGPWLRGRS